MSRTGMAKPLEDSKEHDAILFGFFECGPRDNEAGNRPTVMVMSQRFLLGILWCSRECSCQMQVDENPISADAKSRRSGTRSHQSCLKSLFLLLEFHHARWSICRILSAKPKYGPYTRISSRKSFFFGTWRKGRIKKLLVTERLKGFAVFRGKAGYTEKMACVVILQKKWDRFADNKVHLCNGSHQWTSALTYNLHDWEADTASIVQVEHLLRTRWNQSQIH